MSLSEPYSHLLYSTLWVKYTVSCVAISPTIQSSTLLKVKGGAVNYHPRTTVDTKAVLDMLGHKVTLVLSQVK